MTITRNTVLANGVLVTFSWRCEYLTCNNTVTNVVYSIFNNDLLQSPWCNTQNSSLPADLYGELVHQQPLSWMQSEC